MEENGQDKILAFDTLYTNNHIQKLKILSCYLDHETQKRIAVYIKLLELSHTLDIARQMPPYRTPISFDKKLDIVTLCSEIIPFCDRKEQERLQNLKNMYANFENMQEMMQMVEMMQELMPEGFSPEGGMNGMDLSQLWDLMNANITPDQSPGTTESN